MAAAKVALTRKRLALADRSAVDARKLILLRRAISGADFHVYDLRRVYHGLWLHVIGQIFVFVIFLDGSGKGARPVTHGHFIQQRAALP